MQAVWDLGKGFVGDIVKRLTNPPMPYNTVVTTIRNLEKKGYVTHETFANANRYTPVVDRKTYVGHTIDKIVRKHFNSSYISMLSFFVEDNVVGREELEQALALIREQHQQEGGKQ